MNRLYYEETRRIANEIRAGEMDKEKGAVVAAYELTMKFAKIAREKGLLQLEKEAESLGRDSAEIFLHDLIRLISAGTPSEDVEDIGLTTYFSSETSSYKALIYMIYLRGALLMQEGKSLRTASAVLKAMLPEDLRSIINEQEGEEEIFLGKNREKLLEDIVKDGNESNSDLNELPSVSQAGLILTKLSDSDINRIMKEYPAGEIALVLVPMSGGVRKRVFDSMPHEKALNVAESMMYMGPARYKDIQHACRKLNKKVSKMCKYNEIECRDVDEIIKKKERGEKHDG